MVACRRSPSFRLGEGCSVAVCEERLDPVTRFNGTVDRERFCPHWLQNLLPFGLTWPHWEQARTNFVPHWLQNLALSMLSNPHSGQIISRVLFLAGLKFRLFDKLSCAWTVRESRWGLYFFGIIQDTINLKSIMSLVFVFWFISLLIYWMQVVGIRQNDYLTLIDWQGQFRVDSIPLRSHSCSILINSLSTCFFGTQ